MRKTLVLAVTFATILNGCSSAPSVSHADRRTAESYSVWQDYLASSGKDKLELPTFSEEEAQALFKKAQVWAPTDIPRMNVLRGPKKGSVEPGSVLECTYTETPRVHMKFNCMLPGEDKVGVRVGDGEIYGGVLASHLLWAIGFGSDVSYGIKEMRCTDCPAQPTKSHDNIVPLMVFENVAIERHFPGKRIVTDVNLEGAWSFKDLDKVDPAQGGATKDQTDALQLLMAFIQHWDSKALNQRFVCLKDGIVADENGKASCTKPFLIVNDVGSTFGKGGLMVHFLGGMRPMQALRASKVDLKDWKSRKIFKDAKRCETDMTPYTGGTLKSPVISEGGRKFLSGLLNQLTHDQIRDLFISARIETNTPKATVDEWVDAFEDKVKQINDAHCPE